MTSPHSEHDPSSAVSWPAPRAERPSTWRDTIGEVLRDRRKDLGLRLTDVAERARVSTQYLSEIERGRKEPSSEILHAVTGALGLTFSDLALAVARRTDRRLVRPARFTGSARLRRPGGPVLLAA